MEVKMLNNLSGWLVKKGFKVKHKSKSVKWRMNVYSPANTGSGKIVVKFSIPDQSIAAYHYHDFECVCCGVSCKNLITGEDSSDDSVNISELTPAIWCSFLRRLINTVKENYKL